MYEFIKDNTTTGQGLNRAVDVTTNAFVCDGTKSRFSVGTNIGTLFSVSVNGLAQIRNENYNFRDYTTTIDMIEAPLSGSVLTIQYYKGINSVILDNVGKLLQFAKEEFIYTRSTTFNLSQSMNSLMTVETNGLAEKEGFGFDITGHMEIRYNFPPVIGSKISISYLY
jgi:hypothetical protein